MMEKSQYLETLEKLQDALTKYDMSFDVSGRMLRIALIAEILDTSYLFEQLYQSWCEQLPYGEGPDADIDFSYWKELSSWEALLNGVRQSASIDTYPFDMGNGLTSDRVSGNRRKYFLKNVSSVLRRSKYPVNDETSSFFKAVNSDKSHMLTFGNMIYEALTSLLLTLGKINSLLVNPTEELFQTYYEQQRERFANEIDNAKRRIKDIMHESIVEKRKINRLKEMRDGIIDSLRESGFMTDLKTAYTHYDIEDYRDDNNCPELSDDIVLERLVLEDFLTDDMQLDRKKIAKHIYEHRKTLSREAIATFYIYAEVSPEIERLLNVLKDYDIKHDVKENQHEMVIDKASSGDKDTVIQNITINTVVLNNETNIDKNYGPNIDNHDGGTISLPERIIDNKGN